MKILPRWVIIFIDLAFISFSAFLGYLLRFNFSLGDMIKIRFMEGMGIYAFFGLISVLLTGSYKGIIRYTGLQDGVRIFFMVLLNSAIVVAGNLLIHINGNYNLVPYSVVLITLLSSFLFLFNYRLLVKYIFSFYKNAVLQRSKVLIFGAGQAGMITRHVIDSSTKMQIVGFLKTILQRSESKWTEFQFTMPRNRRSKG